jgi:hypothetical protein
MTLCSHKCTDACGSCKQVCVRVSAVLHVCMFAVCTVAVLHCIFVGCSACMHTSKGLLGREWFAACLSTLLCAEQLFGTRRALQAHACMRMSGRVLARACRPARVRVSGVLRLFLLPVCTAVVWHATRVSGACAHANERTDACACI